MGYSDHQQAAAAVIARCGVLTVSDTRHADNDSSGSAIKRALTAAGHTVAAYAIVPDEPPAIEAALTDLLAQRNIDAILINGGTGISRRDRTIAVVDSHLDQRLDGFGELFRMLSWQEIGSGAMVSRAVGGIAAGKVIFAMPGSTSAVTLAMSKLILPEIKHLIFELRK